MIIKPDSAFGDLRGKLKITPEECLRLYGFTMKPGGTHVIFRGYTYLDGNGHRKKGTFISNYTPPTNNQKPQQQAWRQIMTEAVNDWNATETDKEKWNREAKKLKMTGFNLHNKRYLETHRIPAPLPPPPAP